GEAIPKRLIDPGGPCGARALTRAALLRCPRTPSLARGFAAGGSLAYRRAARAGSKALKNGSPSHTGYGERGAGHPRSPSSTATDFQRLARSPSCSPCPCCGMGTSTRGTPRRLPPASRAHRRWSDRTTVEPASRSFAPASQHPSIGVVRIRARTAPEAHRAEAPAGCPPFPPAPAAMSEIRRRSLCRYRSARTGPGRSVSSARETEKDFAVALGAWEHRLGFAPHREPERRACPADARHGVGAGCRIPHHPALPDS